MKALNFAEAIAEWSTLEGEIHTFTPERLTDEQLAHVQHLENQLSPVPLSQEIASLLRCIWQGVAHAPGEINTSDLTDALWLAATLSDVAAQMATDRGNAHIRLMLHEQAREGHADG